ncbi:hypothetical protein M8C21_010827, partial [Ambrosia artemisiifolia]
IQQNLQNSQNGLPKMKLRSSRVLKGVKPKVDSDIKNQECSNKKRLSLNFDNSTSGKKKADENDIGGCDSNSDEKFENGMKKTVNSDDKGLFLGSEVVDSIKDSVVSCPKQEIKEEEGKKLMSVNLSEMGTKNVEFESGSENFESEKSTADTTVVNGHYGECMFMTRKDKRGRKRKNVKGSSSDCNEDGRAKKEKVENNRVRVIGSKVLRSRALSGITTVIDGGVRRVVLGLRGLDERPKTMLKRCGRPSEEHTEDKNMRSKKKLKKLGIPRKFQGEVTPLPLIEIPRNELKRHGRPPKVSHETPVGPTESKGIGLNLHAKDTTFKKFKRRGRPPKMEAKTLATHVMKMRMKKHVSVKKGLQIRKREGENSGPLIVEEDDNGRKGIISGNSDRRLLKQLVRDKISNILLKSGWTIDFRQRQEKTYKDSVYVEPNGKRTHWSITRAYAKLKKKIETGNADNVEISAFTPIPEEELSLLFRHQEKVRKDKNKKRIKGKIVTYEKKKPGKKTKDQSKRKMIFKPRILARDSKNGLKQGVILAGMKIRYGKTRRQTRSIEVHCGGKIGKVFDNLYLESGTCLRNCLVDSWRKEEEANINRFNVVDVQGDDPNDDTIFLRGTGIASTAHANFVEWFLLTPLKWKTLMMHLPLKCYHVVCVRKNFLDVTVHKSCLQEVDAENIDSDRLPFCRRKCQELFERLRSYLGVKHELEDGLSWTLLQRSDVDQDLNVHGTQLKVEHNSKLAVALSVMDECFVPIKDDRSGTSIIHDVVYNCGRLNYAGFLTAVLEKGDEFICVASIRIHGHQLAEMPFIGTRHMYRRQGMCRRLLDAIELLQLTWSNMKLTLSYLGVEELIIPAIPALLQTWTTAFGFMPLEESKKQAMKRMSMLVFPGIDMLKKPLLQIQSADVDHSPVAGVEKDVIDPEPNDEINPQLETTSPNAIDYEQIPARTAGIGEDGTSNEQTEEATVVKDVIDYNQREKVTLLVDSCSCPDLENDILTASNGVNGLCDLNLPVKNDLPCDADGQTSVDSEIFYDCAVDLCSTDSVVCGNQQSPDLILDAENVSVPGVKVKPSPLTSTSALKNTFDLNLHPTAVETDVHIVNDDYAQCEPQVYVKSFKLFDSRSPVDHSADSQTNSKTCE